MEKNTIIRGNCIEVLKTLPDASVDLVVTDGLMALHECYRTLKKNSNAYMFLDIKHLPIVRMFIEQYTPYTIRDFLVWDKVHIGMGRGFRKQHELIAVLEKGMPAYNKLGLPNVLRQKRVNTADHPHKKPVELMEALIRQSSQPGDIVLDPFSGTGTTCLAAKKLGRKFVGIELEELYYKLAMARIGALN